MLLQQIFINTAKKEGKKVAFNDFATGKKITYTQALIASLLLARIFKKLNKGFVGLMVPTSAGCMLAQVGILMSGRIPVMINYSTGAEHNARYAQKKCDFKTIIASKTLLHKIDCPHIEGMIYLEDIMTTLSKSQKIIALLTSKLPISLLRKLVCQAESHDTALVLFTSGSEKDPKAVPLSHRNIEANVISCNDRFKLRNDDIFMSSLPLFHVFGLTVDMWLPISLGMTILAYANPLDFKGICDAVREEKATCIVGTPSFFWGYLRKSEPGDFSTMRIMICGADKCPDSLREGFLEKHNLAILEGYGATECSPVISANCAEDNCIGSVGRPLAGVQVRIENYETGEECPPGEDGRILVKGENVMKGYFDDFEQTSLHIRRGWYDTGDMGNLDENGYLWHVGRLKRFVKIGGEMVSLVKIESVLDHLLPEEVFCCVVEVPDALKGAKLVAVLTERVDEKTLIKKMSDHLPKIAIPKIFLTVEDLPKMGSGKIDFRAITEMARAQLAGE